MSNLCSSIEKLLIIDVTDETGSHTYQLLFEYFPQKKTKSISEHLNVHFNWNNSATWPNALEGVSHVYFTYSPDLAGLDSTEHILAFCNMAKQYNVKHLTFLSGRG